MSENSATKDGDATIALFLCTFAGGALAFAAGLIFNYERRTMFGIALGCGPTGALGAALAIWGSRWAARRRPDLIRKKANALDERSVQIRHHAGYAAFRAIFVYIVIYTLLSPTQWIRGIGPTVFGIATIYVLTAAYWVAVFIYSRRY